jgi:predicted enzyme related to lactoylglutathione lyase
VGVGGHIRAGETSRVNLYVQVRDVHESQQQAIALGGSVTIEPFDVPGGPRLAGIKDPEGNPLMLVQQ